MSVTVAELAPGLAHEMTEAAQFIWADIEMMSDAPDYDDPVVQAITKDLTRTARRLQSLAAALAALA
jgi:hypothetical protein